jgi:hypothetical protein
MKKFKYVATSSKLLETYGFNNKKTANEWVKEANKRTKIQGPDTETPAHVKTWAEWVEICECNEVSTDVEAGRE